jgi:DNA-binding beta-propeller fold protein YncE
MTIRRFAFLPSILLISAAWAADPIQLPDGMLITPTAVPHSTLTALNPGLPDRPDWTLGQAVTSALSPDGAELLVLTSGYNKEKTGIPGGWNEFVFVYDVRANPPKLVQALPVPNTFCGLAWNPDGREFYVSGGKDDVVHVFERDTASSEPRYRHAASIPLGHPHGLGLLSNLPPPYSNAAPKPMVAGIAVNRSGSTAVVANFYNDSISVIDLAARKKTAELDLRPGVHDPRMTGVPGGEYPYWVAIRGDSTAYVSSPRDREVVIVRLDREPTIEGRIPIPGQPNRLLLNRAEDRLFVAVDNSDRVAVIETGTNRMIASFNVTAPADLLPAGALPKGANPNSLALAPDQRTLYVTDGGTNAVAVVHLEASGAGRVVGLIPTGWYPDSVTVSADGARLYVLNSKSVPGPNPANCRGDARAPGIPDCQWTADQYVLSLQKASLLSMPIPPAAELAALTGRVAENDHFDVLRRRLTDPVIAALRRKIKHVIYIVKENRTYDQILGDLDVGNGDPALAEFPEPVTPNHHALARQFVTLDNFYDSGEVSGVGWNWSTAARATDYTEKTVPPNYAGRGFEYDWEGVNRNVNVGIGSLPERIKAEPLLGMGPKYPADPNLLPGARDVAAPDDAEGEAGAGYIWDEVLRAGLTVRDYGFYVDMTRYDDPRRNPAYITISKDPRAAKIRQAWAAKKSLIGRTDIYFRGFDQHNADFYNYREWAHEFDQYVAHHDLPSLSLVRFCHDHFGSFGTALYGLNTPAMQMSDNDYAVGLLVEKIAHSPYKDSTLIFVIEDDAQDGADHVDAHRSVGYIIGPYVKHRAVVSDHYTTVNMLRTIEAVLGLEPSSLDSAASMPMMKVFDMKQASWSYTAIVPPLLRKSQLPLPPATAANSLPRAIAARAAAFDPHPGSYWQRRLGDMDYAEEDKLDTPRFNLELWKGIMGSRPYPATRSGKDLRSNRAALLRTWGWR